MPKTRLSLSSSPLIPYLFRAFVIAVFLGLCSIHANTQTQDGSVLVGSDLADGLDVGINTSDGKTDWLNKELEYLKAVFPANQKWAAVFITVGEPTETPRPFRDYSSFKTLAIQMRGAEGGEKVEIGLKTNTQPDNGRETKIPYTLTASWVSYEIPLNRFKGTDLSHLYVVTELVYTGQTPQTVYFRDIKFTK